MMTIARIATAAAIASAFSISHLSAADLPLAPEPIPITAPDWTGLYIGGHAGYGWGKMKDGMNCDGFSTWVLVSQPGYPALENCSGGIDILAAGGSLETNNHPGGIYYYEKEDLEDWLAGLQIGYNYQMGNFVIGGEVSGSVTAMSATRQAYLCDSICQQQGSEITLPDGFVTERTDVNWIVLAQAKLGWAMERWMIAAHGGLALVNTSQMNTAGFDDDGVTTAGWTVGGTLEFKATDNLTMFGTYNYIQADGAEHLGSSYIIFPTLYQGDLEIHTLKVGFNRIFN